MSWVEVDDIEGALLSLEYFWAILREVGVACFFECGGVFEVGFIFWDGGDIIEFIFLKTTWAIIGQYWAISGCEMRPAG